MFACLRIFVPGHGGIRSKYVFLFKCSDELMATLGENMNAIKTFIIIMW